MDFKSHRIALQKTVSTISGHNITKRQIQQLIQEFKKFEKYKSFNDAPWVFKKLIIDFFELIYNHSRGNWNFRFIRNGFEACLNVIHHHELYDILFVHIVDIINILFFKEEILFLKELLRFYLVILCKTNIKYIQISKNNHKYLEKLSNIFEPSLDMECEAIIIHVNIMLHINEIPISPKMTRLIQQHIILPFNKSETYELIRRIMNTVNHNYKYKFSILCSQISLNVKPVKEFEDKEQQDIWLDIDLKNRIISFFCAKSIVQKFFGFRHKYYESYKPLAFYEQNLKTVCSEYLPNEEILKLVFFIKKNNFLLLSKCHDKAIQTIEVICSESTNNFEQFNKHIIPKMFPNLIIYNREESVNSADSSGMSNENTEQRALESDRSQTHSSVSSARSESPVLLPASLAEDSQEKEQINNKEHSTDCAISENNINNLNIPSTSKASEIKPERNLMNSNDIDFNTKNKSPNLLKDKTVQIYDEIVTSNKTQQPGKTIQPKPSTSKCTTTKSNFDVYIQECTETGDMIEVYSLKSENDTVEIPPQIEPLNDENPDNTEISQENIVTEETEEEDCHTLSKGNVNNLNKASVSDVLVNDKSEKINAWLTVCSEMGVSQQFCNKNYPKGLSAEEISKLSNVITKESDATSLNSNDANTNIEFKQIQSLLLNEKYNTSKIEPVNKESLTSINKAETPKIPSNILKSIDLNKPSEIKPKRNSIESMNKKVEFLSKNQKLNLFDNTRENEQNIPSTFKGVTTQSQLPYASSQSYLNIPSTSKGVTTESQLPYALSQSYFNIPSTSKGVTTQSQLPYASSQSYLNIPSTSKGITTQSQLPYASSQSYLNIPSTSKGVTTQSQLPYALSQSYLNIPSTSKGVTTQSQLPYALSQNYLNIPSTSKGVTTQSQLPYASSQSYLNIPSTSKGVTTQSQLPYALSQNNLNIPSTSKGVTTQSQLPYALSQNYLNIPSTSKGVTTQSQLPYASSQSYLNIPSTSKGVTTQSQLPYASSLSYLNIPSTSKGVTTQSQLPYALSQNYLNIPFNYDKDISKSYLNEILQREDVTETTRQRTSEYACLLPKNNNDLRNTSTINPYLSGNSGNVTEWGKVCPEMGTSKQFYRKKCPETITSQTMSHVITEEPIRPQTNDMTTISKRTATITSKDMKPEQNLIDYNDEKIEFQNPNKIVKVYSNKRRQTEQFMDPGPSTSKGMATNPNVYFKTDPETDKKIEISPKLPFKHESIATNSQVLSAITKSFFDKRGTLNDENKIESGLNITNNSNPIPTENKTVGPISEKRNPKRKLFEHNQATNQGFTQNIDNLVFPPPCKLMKVESTPETQRSTSPTLPPRTNRCKAETIFDAVYDEVRREFASCPYFIPRARASYRSTNEEERVRVFSNVLIQEGENEQRDGCTYCTELADKLTEIRALMLHHRRMHHS